MRSRLATVSAVAFSFSALLAAGQARAAAEVHRFSVVLSANPTGIEGGDVNTVVDYANRVGLEPYGLAPVKHVSFTWAYDAEMRYFVRPNFAVAAGLSHIKVEQKQEYLPAIDQNIVIRSRLLTVPVHVGGAYYLQPYNQGDFQARAFIGAGLEQYTYTRGVYDQHNVSPFLPNGNFTIRQSATQDSPGYYLEGGAQMFFASRYSVIISALYRSGKLRDAQYDEYVNTSPVGPTSTPNFKAGDPAYRPDGKPFEIDVSGAGVRFAVSVGL